MQAPLPSDGPLQDLRIMLTAREAFPYLENMFLQARKRIVMGFRVFDPETHLISAEARACGETWADLIAATLRRGVHISLVISDFDPVGAPDNHRETHRSLRLLRERAEREGVADGLDAQAHLHPATVGPILRLLFAPLARHDLSIEVRRLNDQGKEIADKRLVDMPKFRPLVSRGSDGNWRPARLALPRLHPCTHHQKLAVADGSHLYIGGLDLDDRRHDGLEHDRAASRTWHDVQLGLTGPIAADAEAHLHAFRAEVERRQKPKDSEGLLRTLSGCRKGLGRLRMAPKPLRQEIFGRTLQAVDQAQELVYLETQFLRDTRFARILAARGKANPKLGLIVVLPAAPEDVAFMRDHSLRQRFGEHMQAKCVEILTAGFGERATFVSPVQPRGVAPDGTRRVVGGSPIIYVHAKVTVVDTTTALVSSANLNGRSHRWDTEAGVALTDCDQVALLRKRLMTHWLPEDAAENCLDPSRAPGAWAALAKDNLNRQPNQRRGFLVPFPSVAPRRFGRPIPFMPQEMV